MTSKYIIFGSLLQLTDIISSFSQISGKYNTLICDLWGCLHNGEKSFPRALRALKEFRANGGTVILVTNAPRPIENVNYQIQSLGITKQHYDKLLTSGELTSNYIKKSSIDKINIFHIGGKLHHSIYKSILGHKKLNIENKEILNADLIVCTEPFNPKIDQISDYEKMLEVGVNNKLTFLCANPDLVVDVGEKREMCAGSLALLYEKMGGKVIYFGKPHKNIYEEAYSFLTECHQTQVASILCIGDGLKTDIQGANNENLDSLLVVGGLLRKKHLLGNKKNTIIDEKLLNQTIETNKVKVDYAIKFFQ